MREWHLRGIIDDDGQPVAKPTSATLDGDEDEDFDWDTDDSWADGPEIDISSPEQFEKLLKQAGDVERGTITKTKLAAEIEDEELRSYLDGGRR